MGLSLPKELSKPLGKLGDYSLLIYGREKIGKTDLASQFPDAFFLMCEPGGKALRIKQRAVKTWRDFKGYITLLNENPDYCKTVIVDTIDLAYKMCSRHVLKLLGIMHASEEKWGKAFDMVRDEFASQMQLLLPGRGVIFLSHEDEKPLPPGKLQIERSRIIPTMPKQARKVIEPMVDVWGYYEYDSDGKRWLWIRGNKYMSAGCRLKENFVGVRKIYMGESAKEGYSNLVSAFKKTIPEMGEGKKKVIIRKK